MCNLSGTFCFDKSLFLCSEFLQVSSKHRNFMSFFRFVLKGISCAQNKNFWSFCTEVKRFWKTVKPFDSILEQIGYRYKMNQSFRFMHCFISSHNNIYFMPFYMYASKGGACHFDGRWYNKVYNFLLYLNSVL